MGNPNQKFGESTDGIFLPVLELLPDKLVKCSVRGAPASLTGTCPSPYGSFVKGLRLRQTGFFE